MEHPRIKLKRKSKLVIREVIFIIVSFTLLMYFYYFITWWGLKPYLKPNLFGGYLDSGYAFLEIGIQGIVFGLLFALINIMLDRTRLRRKSFGTIILIKSILYFIAVTVSQLAVFIVYHVFSIFPVDVNEVQSDLYPSATISMLVYFTFVILLISFLQQINKKFGNGILLSMITGKYYHPRKERRIFMFLDMKDSTGIAERLGHVQYSRLIQRCIHELSDLITRYKAQVYQYVGDEVVLTWPTDVGLKDMNCINLYFAFRQVLEDRRQYYEKNYNTLPEFKAGIAEGIITVTEVGEIKRELAYHGDVLHTAARLEKMCNKLENNVLITEKMISLLDGKNGYDMKLLGEFRLRGKEGLDKIYGVRLNV